MRCLINGARVSHVSVGGLLEARWPMARAAGSEGSILWDGGSMCEFGKEIKVDKSRVRFLR